ncbi:MAG: formylglycine-generating enzyme family protein, partial [Planctomycetes bacterium]|nr:formylglycine-generating enzyme family protein [Planctomycetota bacterium]
CGSKSSDAPPVAKQNPPVAPNPVAPNPNPQANPANGPGRAVVAGGQPKKLIPDGTDPKDVFEVKANEQKEEVLAPLASKPDEEFLVASVPEFSLDLFEVGKVPPVGPAPSKKSDFKLPEGFVFIEREGYSSDGIPLAIRCEKSKTELRLVPAGVFTMGTNDGPPECGPQFSVHIDSYYMDQFEVTVGQFEEFREYQKEKKKIVAPPTNVKAPSKMPVLGVPFGVAQAYARWLGLELPTEAEFEKASRGPSSFQSPWGNGRAIWPRKRTPETLTVIGAFPSDVSPYGIYDLAGNAKEWCTDVYSDRAFRDLAATKKPAPHNWNGPKKGANINLRVVKGNGTEWSAWSRQGREINKGQSDVGFRCVLRIRKTEPNEAKSGT